MRLGPVLLSVHLVVGGLLTGVAIVSVRYDMPISTFMGDPLAVGGDLPIYTGIVSTLTGLVWSATVAVCLFAAWLPSRMPSEERSFLAAAGCTTALLLADDVFQFHDGFSNRVMGIDEKAVNVGYVAIVMALLLRYGATIMGTDYLPLAMALAAFAVSAGIDQIAAFHPNLLEDGAKLIGIAGWSTYFIMLSARSLCGPEPHPAT